jgi:hypothetical protein
MSIAAEKLPLPRRDVRKKKLPRRCRDATDYKKILPHRCRDVMAYKLAAAATRRIIKKSCRTAAATRWLINLPLPRWFSKKLFKFHCHGCIGPEIFVLDDQIHSVSGCFTCKH